MEIQVDRLRQALELVAPALPKGKVTLPITTAVLFQNGKLTATNLEMWISVDLPELGRSRTGFVLRHRALTETLKYVPGRQVLTITPERANVVLQTTGSRTSLVKPGQPRDFPPLPNVEGTDFLIDGDRLVRGLLEVLPYAATRVDRPTLTSVAMKLDYELELVTADGFRLAIYQPGIQLSGEGTGHQALVPAATVHALSQLWRKADKTPDMDAAKAVGEAANRGSIAIARLAVARRNLRMTEDGGHITFSFGSVRLCSQLLQGEFPRYQQLVPETEGGPSVSVSADELARVVNQVASIAGEGSNMARLQWSGDQLTVLAQAADVGETQASIPAHVAGGDGEIAFNLGYLQQYLRGKTHVVTIAMVPGDPAAVRGKPGVFTHRGGPMVVMMPMFVAPRVEHGAGSAEAVGAGSGETEPPAGDTEEAAPVSSTGGQAPPEEPAPADPVEEDGDN